MPIQSEKWDKLNVKYAINPTNVTKFPTKVTILCQPTKFQLDILAAHEAKSQL